MKFVRAAGVKRGKRQNDKIHDLLDRGTKKQAAYQRVLRHERQLAAHRVVNGRCRASDKEVQEDTKNIGTGASLESLAPEEASGNHERDVPAKQDASLEKVQSSGDPAADGDCQ